MGCLCILQTGAQAETTEGEASSHPHPQGREKNTRLLSPSGKVPEGEAPPGTGSTAPPCLLHFFQVTPAFIIVSFLHVEIIPALKKGLVSFTSLWWPPSVLKKVGCLVGCTSLPFPIVLRKFGVTEQGFLRQDRNLFLRGKAYNPKNPSPAPTPAPPPHGMVVWHGDTIALTPAQLP